MITGIVGLIYLFVALLIVQKLTEPKSKKRK